MAPRSTPDPSTEQPSPRPSPRRPSSGPMFQTPDETTTTPPTSTHDALPAPSPSPLDELPDESAAPSDARRTSSKGSSETDLASANLIVEGFRKMVLAAGTIAYRFLARDDIAAEQGQYLVAEEEAEAIGDPLAKIASRHGGIGAAGNPDLVDAFAALLGLAFYTLRQLDNAAIITAARRNRARAAAHDVDSGGEDA